MKASSELLYKKLEEGYIFLGIYFEMGVTSELLYKILEEAPIFLNIYSGMV
jgi:hypothetical protein